MDRRALAQQLEQMVPFLRHCGIVVTDLDQGTCVARLPEAAHLSNHIGSQHAGALFTLGESASGGAVLGALGEDLVRFTPLARSAEIRYLKPARGPVEARARVSEPIAEVRARLAAAGKTDFDVAVELDCAGVKVAELTVRWHLRAVAP
jgi:uncharacterized protein (TIGR00369 family)